MKKFFVLFMVAVLLLGNAQCVLADEDEVVIVLDPGHDATHGGASANGVGETVTNLKIAQYCYEELSTYKNVKVYMTRTTTKCPFPNAKDSGEDIKARVNYASSVGADAYVSFHLNSTTSTSVKGVEVYVPNMSWRAEIGQKGKDLGTSVAKQLKALGLYEDPKWGSVRIRNSANGSTYDDGSIADYYALIKEAKKLNFPGIIIEHAYISNTSDVENFLNSDAKLKALGVADATGIAQYYGLSKPGSTTTPEPEPAPTPTPTETESGNKEEKPTPDISTEKDTETEIETGTEIETETQTEPIVEVGGNAENPPNQAVKEDPALGWIITGTVILAAGGLGVWWYKKNSLIKSDTSKEKGKKQTEDEE